MATEAATIRHSNTTPSSLSSASKVRPLSLRHNFSWTLIGNVIYAGCQWGILVVAVRFGSKAIAGQLILALAVTAPITRFFQLELRTVLGTDIQKEYSLSHYLKFRLTAIFLATIATSIVACSGYFSSQVMWVIILLSLAKGVESFSDICYGWFQRNERMNQVAFSMITRGVLALCLFTALFYWTDSLAIGVLGMLLARLLTCIFYDLSNVLLSVKRMGVSFHETSSSRNQLLSSAKSLAVYRALLWKALPLGVMWLFVSLSNNIPYYFIEKYCGEATLGVFGCIVYFMRAGGLAMHAIAASASPKLAKYYSRGDLTSYVRLLKKLVLATILLGGVIVFVPAVLGQDILWFVYGEDYVKYSQILTLIMAAGAVRFVGAALGAGITATRKFHLFPPFYFFSCIVVLGVAWLFIPSFGIWGAAWTICIAEILSSISFSVILFVIWRSHYGQVRSTS